MRIKSLIYNLLNLSKSASFVLFTLLYVTNCHQVIAREQDLTVVCLFEGPPTTNNGGGSGTGK